MVARLSGPPKVSKVVLDAVCENRHQHSASPGYEQVETVSPMCVCSASPRCVCSDPPVQCDQNGLQTTSSNLSYNTPG